MKGIVLRTEKLSYYYGKGSVFEHKAIDNVEIEINRGELIGIIGHTGSGKSTLIQHFNALLKPSEGKIYVNDKDIWESKTSVRQVRFTVGLCFQYPEYQLFEETVEKDIAFGPKNMGLEEKEIYSRVLESMGFVGLDKSYLDKSPFDLSGGEKRRVAIAGVMAMKPEILILDEPCAGLDPRGRNMILSLIKSYRDSTGSTVMIVSHSMEDIAQIADKVLVMNESKVAMFGTIDEVYSRGEELKNMGLNIPEITALFIRLKEQGYDVSDKIYTVKQAEEEILAYLDREVRK